MLNMWLIGIVICAEWILSICLYDFTQAIVGYENRNDYLSQPPKSYLIFSELA
jgi:hypothetical protein